MEFSPDFIKEVKLIKTRKKTDIYDGTENLRFEMRHPIFKALMKLEFEDIIRNDNKRINPIK